MGRTSTTRRLVFIKKTKNPVVPRPQRREAPSGASDAKPSATFAAPVRRPAAASGGNKLMKFAALFAGVVCLGAAAGAMSGKQRAPSAPEYELREISQTAVRPSFDRTETPLTERELRGEPLPAMLAQRSAPTDEGFRASIYARRR